MSDELKPCPFCGCEARHANGWATCSNFSCFVSDNGVKADKWNTRADHIVDANEKVNTFQNGNSWISVDDRLPDDDERLCVAWSKYLNDYVFAFYDPSARCWDMPDYGWDKDHDITHWQPLPEPPL